MLCKEELSEVSCNCLKVEVIKGFSDKKVSNDSEEVLLFFLSFLNGGEES